MAHSNDRPANRLANETSPYLLQHAHNPVDWYPWGPEAIERARSEDRPIFLSVGYSACHWCHVMERESFEHEGIARLMNEYFVNIKVDREERPDIDQIYMAAVQAMTGHGGWPMSVFLTPELKPYYGGTYYPPTDVRGMAGFPRVLEELHRAWVERREEVERVASGMAEQLDGLGRVPAGEGSLDADLLDGAAKALKRAFEPRYGGFGSAPKFPHPMDLRVLLRQYARRGDVEALRIVRHTLDHMARGGIYDHLGGGFARYSTDDRWLVPHFEKMLYDNALLATVYLESYRATRNPEDANVASEILDYVLQRMTSPAGGFYSTEDADSEGEEGKYHVWSLDEIREILGPERTRTFAYVYDVTEAGNWEGKSILNLPKPLDQAAAMLGRNDVEVLRADLAEDRARLLEARERRVSPGKDTKVLASWNGLMIAALAEGGRTLKEPRYLDAAGRAADFLRDQMRQPDGRLWHSARDGRAKVNGMLEDYAYVLEGLVRLYESTGDLHRLETAVDLARIMIDQFTDADDGGFFDTGRDHETLIVRPKSLLDNATPSANAVAATALLRLGALTGQAEFADAGRSALQAAEPVMRRYPTGAGQSFIALDFALAPPREIAVIAGESDPREFRAVLETLHERFEPGTVIAPSPGGAASAELASRVPLLADRPARGGRATTYICRNYTCDEPAVGVEGLEAALRPSPSPSQR